MDTSDIGLTCFPFNSVIVFTVFLGENSHIGSHPY
jgi:hypothetical protein